MPDAAGGWRGDPAELQAQADQLLWFHSIDLGNGVRTRGLSNQVYSMEQFPPLAGRSVLDIGAWDGYHSFLAEKAGASRVVALDHYVWGVDIPARQAYWDECAGRGELPDHSRDATDFWLPDLPGRRGFDFAKAALGSAVEPVVADFMTTDLDALGVFDVVLYLGVLYHMKEPLTALERVRKVTGTVAVIETEAVHYEGMGDQSILQFEPGNAVNRDFGNWYLPNMRALQGLCQAAGFRRAETVVGPAGAPPVTGSSSSAPAHHVGERLARTLRLLKTGANPGIPARHYRAMVYAYV